LAQVFHIPQSIEPAAVVCLSWFASQPDPCLVMNRSPAQPKTSGSAHSRSTSAGSSSSAGQCMEAQYSTAAREIPDYDYPVPLIVKNTFIDTQAWRPSSLDGFFQERVTRSCVSRLEEPCPVGLELIAAPPRIPAPAVTEDDLEFYDALDAFPASPWGVSPICRPQPVCTPEDFGKPQTMSSAGASTACVLRLSEVIPETTGPSRGAASEFPADMELPTVGSAGHFAGTCKPCAFFHTKGCRQGTDCEFCHLCEAGERKRRRKEKVAVIRQQRELDTMPETQDFSQGFVAPPQQQLLLAPR